MPRIPAAYDVQVAGVKAFAMPVKYMVDDVGEGELLLLGVPETVPLGSIGVEDVPPIGSTPCPAVEESPVCEGPPVIVGLVAPEGSVVNPGVVLEGWLAVPVPVPDPPSSPVEDGGLVSSDPLVVVVADVSVSPPDPSVVVVVADVSVSPPDPSVVVVETLSVLVLCPPEEVSVEVDESPGPGDSTGRVSQKVRNCWKSGSLMLSKSSVSEESPLL